jgi:penicillin-binding protein 2
VSFHPNAIARRARGAAVAIAGVFALLLGAFFRTQVLQHERYVLQSEENRLREVPIPAPRGIVYDRNGLVLAENIPGYTVSLLAPSGDSLRAVLARVAQVLPLPPEAQERVVRRWHRDRTRPAVILGDATFEQVSILEERRLDFPGLIIQSAPKRHYPDGPAVASFLGYVGEINESELADEAYRGYRPGNLIGRAGLEKQYEGRLHGREGVRFVEVDARGRVVRDASSRDDLSATPAEPLYTNIDLALQRYAAELFGDSLQGGIVALDPTSGEVLALHSAPSYDPNRFVGGIPADYWRALNGDPRRPLYNKALQGRYPPASTFKLATAALAMEQGLATLETRMPVACSGGFQFGNRYFRCWKRDGHGDVNLAQAIASSCDTYFYQLGLKLGLSRLIGGGVSLGFRERTGIDLPDEAAPRYPETVDYYNRRYGPRGWSNAVVLNLAIGQGENDQTVLSMARFYAALAGDGSALRPSIVRRRPERQQVLRLRPEQLDGLRRAMIGVVSAGGTAGSARIRGVTLAGKTGTAQNAQDPNHDHAWFVGFAPAEAPRIVVAVMIEFGEHGYVAARLASKLIERYLQATPTELPRQEGG